MQNKVYVEKHKLLFIRDHTGFFIPYMYDCVYDKVEQTFKGKKISIASKEILGKVMFCFILFMKNSGSEVDRTGGKNRVKEGYGEIYQYIISYVVIRHLILLDSSDIFTVISRQAGKSEISRRLLAFALTFIPLYVEIPHARFYCTLCSFKMDTAGDQLLKTQPAILDAIKTFNGLYPKSPLQYDCTVNEKGRNRKLKWNKSIIEINREIDGNSISYSALDILGLDNKANNPGYTSHLLFCDEAQEITADSFNTDVKPFTTSTGGICYCIGTANNDPSTLLKDMYDDKSIPNECRLICDWEEVYKHKALVSEKHGEKYKTRVEKEIAKYGIMSDYIQSQYYVNFNIIGDNFITLDILKRNNILLGDLDKNFKAETGEFKIAGLDGAIANDMAVLVCGTSRFGNASTINEVKDLFILKDKKEAKITPKRLYERTTEICMAHKIDMIIVDDSANQRTAYYLYQEFKKQDCKTFIVPYNYSGKNKKIMMGWLENCLYNQSLILPKLEYSKESYPYKELLNQLLYLKKTTTPAGNIEYKAPEGVNFYDDFPMALAEFNFCLEYVNREATKRKVVDLGDGLKYFIRLHKYTLDKKVNKRNEKSYLTI